MNAWQIVILVGAGVLVFWAIGAGQRLSRLRSDIQTRFQLVDAQLRRQDEVLAALDAALREHALGELPTQVLAASRQALAAAALLREAAHVSGRARGLTMAEQVLSTAIAAARPALQAQAQDQPALLPPLEALQAASHQLDLARESFDRSVEAYNAAVHQFPTRLLAALSGFARAGQLQPPEHAAEHEPQRVQS